MERWQLFGTAVRLEVWTNACCSHPLHRREPEEVDTIPTGNPHRLNRIEGGRDSVSAERFTMSSTAAIFRFSDRVCSPVFNVEDFRGLEVDTGADLRSMPGAKHAARRKLRHELGIDPAELPHEVSPTIAEQY